MELEHPLATGRLEQLKLLEHEVCCAIARTVRDGAVVAVLRVASRFGDRGLSLTVGLVLAVVEPLALLVFSGATAAALLIQGRLKVLCARMRPCAHPGGPPQRAPIPDAGSFPSGHTLHAVMGAVVIVAQVPVLALVFAAVAVLIGTSRVVLGVHYPTDVLAGALIGLLLGSASNLVIALI